MPASVASSAMQYLGTTKIGEKGSLISKRSGRRQPAKRFHP
jgi:hypothetical protein